MAKRNAHGSGTIRQRPDGRWEARYTTGRHPGTGKQLQKSVYGATQAEVRKKLSAATAAIDTGTYLEPSKLTVGAWLDVWLTEYTGNLKERSKLLYRGQVEHHIKPALGAVKLASLAPHHVQRFYNAVLAGTEGRQAVSPKTVRNLHGIFHKALQQAVSLGYIKVNPSDACTLPRVEKAEVKALDATQIAAFLQAIKGHQYERLYLLDLFTGMRLGEITGLTWDCVDAKRGTIRIYRQLQRIGGVYQLVPLKNDKARQITPAPSVMQILAQQRRTQAEWRLKAGEAWSNGGFVFTDELGGHTRRETVYRNFKRIIAELGLPETRFHDLHHSYAVAAIQSGDDIKTLQENLGHATVSFTLDIYGHVTEQMQQASAQRMEQFIQTVKAK